MKKIILLISLLISLSNPCWAAKVYKWVDEHGQVHYGENPPAEASNADEVKVKTDPTPPPTTPSNRLKKQQELINAYSEERRTKTEQKEKDQKEKQNLKRNCQIAKNRYQDYLRTSRLYSNDKEGNRVYLTEKQREESIKSYKNAMEQHCK